MKGQQKVYTVMQGNKVMQMYWYKYAIEQFLVKNVSWNFAKNGII